MKTFCQVQSISYGILQFGKILFITRINKHAVNTISCGAGAENLKNQK